MKAVIYEQYGPPEVLQLRELPIPLLRRNDILVRVRATTVRAGDWRMRKPDPAAARLFNGIFKPKRVQILGMELSGDVEDVGDDAQKFKPGDQVFASTELRFGAYAEYTLIPEESVVAIKPVNLSHEESAAIPSGALGALNILNKGMIHERGKVLVIGASGSVGSFGIQLAKFFGAEVTGVCSISNEAWVQQIGADRVIDYTRENFIEMEDRYDLIFDAVGKRISGLSKSECKKALALDGVVVSIEDSYKEKTEDLELIREIVEAGKLIPVIDRTYPIEEIVEAHHYVEKGHKKGNVVITI